jgi:hypothetical protein
MAGQSTVKTSKEYSTGIKVVTCVFTADDTSNLFASAVLGGERGKELINVSTKAGGTGPTADSDLTITDSISGRNLVATNGADSVDNSGSNYVAPELNSIAIGDLTVAITGNAVASAVTTVYLVFKSKNL